MIPGMVTPPPVGHGMVVPSRGRGVQQSVKSSYPSTHMQRGFYLKQRGDIDGALLEFLKAVQEDPRNVRAFYEQALIFKQRGYNKLAQSALQQAVAVRPDFRDARMMLASIHLEDGDVTQAARELFGSLGISLGPKVAPAPIDAPPAVPKREQPKAPAMIQTPHGEMRLPVPIIQKVVGVRPAPTPPPPAPNVVSPVPSQPSTLPDLTQLLKGIPGVDPTAKAEMSTSAGDAFGSNEPSSSNPTPVAASSAVVALPQSQVDEKKPTRMRKRKRRVAAWLDNLLDSGHVPLPANLEEEEQQATIAAANSEPKLSINPLRLLQRMAQLPLPILHPFEHHGLPAPEVSRVDMVRALPPAPVPVVGNDAGAQPLPMPQLAPQAKLSAALPLPPAVPAPNAHNRMAPNLVAPQPALEAGAVDPLQAVLSLLPKDLAATVAHVLQPKPVEIAANNATAPQLQSLRGVGAAGGMQAPQPVTATAMPAPYENLVSARTAADSVAAFVPAPVRPVLAPAAVPAPLPASAYASNTASSASAPVAPTVRNIAAPMPAPLLPNVQASRAEREVRPSGPTARVSGDAAGPVNPTVQPMPSAYYARVNTAPLPVTVATTSVRGTPAPVVQEYHSNGVLPALVPVSGSTANGASAPDVVAMNVPAPQAVPQYVPSKLPDLPAQFVATPVAQRLAAQGFKFVAPVLTPRQRDLLNTMNKAAAMKPKLQAITTKPKVEPPPPPEDEFTKRMRYLLAHGTASLGPGEAFMFSEETGEGVLFLRGGATVRRKLAAPQDAEQVARLRRPDILAPQGDLQYNLSLLGKIIKPRNDQPSTQARKSTDPVPPAAPLSVKDLLGNEDGFFGWIKNVFKF